MKLGRQERINRVKSEQETKRPLTQPELQVLLALASGDKHGYAILRGVSEETNGRVRMNTGTLYNVIKRLLQEGMIQELRERPAPELDDQRRRYYRLTAWGREVAVAQLEQMESVVTLARTRHLLDEPDSA